MLMQEFTLFLTRAFSTYPGPKHLFQFFSVKVLIFKVRFG